jgi:transposase
MISLGRTPAPRLSATIFRFSSIDQRRHRSPRVITSIRCVEQSYDYPYDRSLPNRRARSLTGMTQQNRLIVLEVFDAMQSSRGEPGHDDRKFLEAMHYFTVHSITWRALPHEFGNWNSVWKRFWRLSRSGVFEAFFQILAEFSETAHLMQFFDSTTVRAHISAAGAKATVLAVKQRSDFL